MKAIRSKDYLSGMKGTLCKLYDGEPLVHRLKKAQNSITVGGSAVILAATNKTAFETGVDRDDILNGLLSRFMFVTPNLREVPTKRGPDLGALDALADKLAERAAPLRSIRWATLFRQGVVEEQPEDDAFVNLDTAEMGYLLYDLFERQFMPSIGKEVDLDSVTYDPQLSGLPAGRDLARIKKLAVVLETLEAEPQIRVFTETGWRPTGARAGDAYLLVRDRNLKRAFVLVARSREYAKRALRWLSSSEDQRIQDTVLRELGKRPDGMTASHLYSYAKAAKGMPYLRNVLKVLEESGLIYSAKSGRGSRWFLAGRGQRAP
jgi:hypothetical protein